LSPSAALIPFNSPLESPSENANTVERLIPFFDHRFQRLPLLVAPEFGLLLFAGGGVGRFRRTAGVEHAALGCTAERDALHAVGRRRLAARRAGVEEHVDRPPASGKRFRRHDRGEHRILVVLAHRYNPHVDRMLSHQPWEERVQPFPEPLLLHRGLVAHGAERPRRLALGEGGCHGNERDREDTRQNSAHCDSLLPESAIVDCQHSRTAPAVFPPDRSRRAPLAVAIGTPLACLLCTTCANRLLCLRSTSGVASCKLLGWNVLAMRRSFFASRADLWPSWTFQSSLDAWMLLP
jgi:hypothetical protein